MTGLQVRSVETSEGTHQIRSWTAAMSPGNGCGNCFMPAALEGDPNRLAQKTMTASTIMKGVRCQV